MRKKSKELLDMALRELHTAINEGKEEVKFVLKNEFSGNQEDLQRFSDKYELKEVTELLRKELEDYEIKSIIYGEPNSLAIVCFSKGPCKKIGTYSIVWKLLLQTK